MANKIIFTAVFLTIAAALPAQWTQLPTFTSSLLLDAAFSSIEAGVVVGEKGAVYKTADGGKTWEFISPGEEYHYTSVAVASASDFYVAGYKSNDDGSGVTTLFASHDAGRTWNVINSYDVVGERCHVRLQGTTIYFLGAWKGLQRSNNGGQNWELVFRGGGTTLLADLKTDPADPSSVFIFGNVGGFATYSCLFRHTAKGSPWDGCNPFEFGGSAAFTAYDFMHDSVIVFRNNYRGFMPNDTSNILSVAYDFVRDDLIPGGGTGDTIWHFKIKTLNDQIPHLVNDCKFFSLTGTGYSVEEAGGINRTLDGGITWSRVYEGREALKAIRMLTDSTGYAVGANGTVVKLGGGTSGMPDKPEDSFQVKVYPTPATDLLTIESAGNLHQASVTVLNESGQVLLTREMNGSRMQIDVMTWPSGLYFVRVEHDGKFSMNRFIR
jgi:photosystem II stability/assembly factor-like uncharacterized protein